MRKVIRGGTVVTAADAVQADVLAHLTRVTPYTIVQPGSLRRQLAKVVRDDYATTVEEMSLGVCSVGVPVRRGGDERGRVRIARRPAQRSRSESRAVGGAHDR